MRTRVSGEVIVACYCNKRVQDGLTFRRTERQLNLCLHMYTHYVTSLYYLMPDHPQSSSSITLGDWVASTLLSFSDVCTSTLFPKACCSNSLIKRAS